jgi:hypothetical protein
MRHFVSILVLTINQGSKILINYIFSFILKILNFQEGKVPEENNYI